jgi:predicted MFS family arabinose efflux permease
VSGGTAGLLVTTYALGVIVGALVVTALTYERIGRKNSS